MPATTLTDRALIRVSGDDPRGFLQGLVTNDLAELAPDRPLWAGLLTPQGKALFDFLLWDGTAIGADGAVLIDCEAAQAEALTRRLALYRLRRAIELTPLATAVHWAAAGQGGQADPRLAALGRRWLGAPDDVAPGWHEHRLRLGVAEGAAELGSGEMLWLECNADLLNGVSFTKGCYVGQENTARMHHRAKVNRRLMVAPLGMAGPRTRAMYAELGLMVELRRVDEAGDALMSPWLNAAT